MVGSSISGVSFVSVPGWVLTTDMTYMQMVLGFFFGYVVIATVLLPVYYKLKLTSIYEYLDSRLGRSSYRTGASFFILAKLVGSAARLYIVAVILQSYVLDQWNVPFYITVFACIFIIWLYTFRSGMLTIVWTDMLQTLCLTAIIVIIICRVKDYMVLDMSGIFGAIGESRHFRMFEFEDWSSRQHFVKQFLSGVFIPVVMTGLDQDMMQKNLTCRSLREAQKNVCVYGSLFIPLNLLLLSLGVLLIAMAARFNIALPSSGDDILPVFCTSGMLGNAVIVFFTIGIIAAAFNSADSALTALTTSFCIDILGMSKEESSKARRTRFGVHLTMCALTALTVFVFKAVNDRSVIDAVYTIVSYAYGPLLGLFVFGLFTKRIPRSRFVPFICVAAPVICYLIDCTAIYFSGYRFGYELLVLNGLLTFSGLYFTSKE
jgi:Na+/proline symporter